MGFLIYRINALFSRDWPEPASGGGQDSEVEFVSKRVIFYLIVEIFLRPTSFPYFLSLLFFPCKEIEKERRKKENIKNTFKSSGYVSFVIQWFKTKTGPSKASGGGKKEYFLSPSLSEVSSGLADKCGLLSDSRVSRSLLAE
jgi:hypothetical protein